MTVIAKRPTTRSTGTRIAAVFVVFLLFLGGIALSVQGEVPISNRSFGHPSETNSEAANNPASTTENASPPLLRHGKPQERHPQENSNSNIRVSFDLANLKDGGTGTLVFEILPAWAPLGVAHLLELLDANFYTDCRIFRVVPNFVAQFGMSGDPTVQQEWSKKVITDDPVVQSNRRGTLTYATSGKDSRTTQLFINFSDNKRLDGQGFAPIGQIVEGEEYLDQIQDKYRQQPSQGQIRTQGNVYLNEKFPDLTYIQAVRVVNN